MKILWVALLMIGSISTSANSKMASMIDIDCRDCNYPPVRTTPAFTFEEATRNFQSAKPISPADLVGSWKQVAGVQAADVFAASSLMGYNEDGIKNSYEKILKLEVSRTTLSGGFFENDAKDIITIIIANLGTNDQGPYDVIVNEAGQACFSTKSYGRENGYYAFECRELPKNNSKILCAVTLNSNGIDLNPEQKPYDGKVGFYLGFVRK